MKHGSCKAVFKTNHWLSKLSKPIRATKHRSMQGKQAASHALTHSS